MSNYFMCKNSTIENVKNNEFWMNYAINLASRAEKEGEVPIGAIVILNNKIIGEGWNCSIKLNDPTGHAEIIALRNSALKIKNYRLLDTSIYVTLEPCLMCIGAILNARVSKLIFGAYRDKTNKITEPIVNLNNISYGLISIIGGVLRKNCSDQLKSFFNYRR